MTITIESRESDSVYGKYSLFISFPYNQKIVDIIRSFPTRYWHPNLKEWELPLDAYELFCEKTKDFFEIETRFNHTDDRKEVKDIEYEFKTKPFEHQIDGFNYGKSHTHWLLCDEQGLGKTKQVIDIATYQKLKFGFKHCLIICGVNGLKWNWYEEVKKHSNETAYILGQRTNRKGKLVVKGNKDKLYDLTSLLNGYLTENYFLITNVESLRSKEIAEKLSELCKQDIISMIAFDEAHKAKDSASQQGKGLLKLKANYMIAMTGTPIMNSPLDVYTPLRWIGMESRSFYAFRNHYCILGGYCYHDVVGYKNMDDLQEKVNSVMLRRKKEDVLDLPEKLYIDEYVGMTYKQEQIYNEVTADIKAHIDEIMISPNPLGQLIRLRQATGYTGILSSTIQESAKMERLVEIVEESISNNRKVVIFSNWAKMTDAIFSKLNAKNIWCEVITGNTKDDMRQQAVDNFQHNDNYKVIIGTIGAMGTGLTLTAGTVVIFFDEPWTKADKNQAEDRCHRIGTTQNITIYTLMCKDTIDERVHDIVEQKGMISDAIVDGKVSGNKLEVLNFLLS